MKFFIKKFFSIHYNSENVFEHFNLETLKNDGIKHIVFDLDNTLCTNLHRVANDEQIKFLTNVSKHFDVIICSNNTKARVEEYINSLPITISGYSWCKKPLKYKISKILKKHNFDKKSTLFVGDQLITDIIISNRMKSKICFVKPLHQKELGLTKFNRNFENFIMKKINKYELVKWGEKW